MALATMGSPPGTVVMNGDIHGSSDATQPELTPTGVTPGTYNFPNLVVDVKGRVLSIEDAQLGDIPCASSIVHGTVTAGGGGTNIINTAGTISVPVASGSVVGLVEVGSGFRLVGNVLEVDYAVSTTSTLGVVRIPVAGNLDVDGAGEISVPLATPSVVGVVSADGTTVLVDGAGELSITPITIPDATTGSKGDVQVGDNIDLLGSPADGIISAHVATTSELGVVQIGDNIDLLGSPVDGVISMTTAATISSLGVVEIGTGLLITGGGLMTLDLSIFPDATTGSKGLVELDPSFEQTGGVLSISDATISSLGIVQVGDNIDATAGVISVAIATPSVVGLVKAGTDITIDGAGEISANIPASVDATPSVKGIVQIGDNIDVGAGIITVPPATNTTLGVASTDDISHIDITVGAIDIGSGVITDVSPQRGWTYAQVQAMYTLPTSGTVTPDGQDGAVFYIDMTGDVTLNAVLNPSFGNSYDFIVNTNGFILTLDSDYLVRGTGTITGISVVSCVYNGTNFLTITQPNFI